MLSAECAEKIAFSCIGSIDEQPEPDPVCSRTIIAIVDRRPLFRAGIFDALRGLQDCRIALMNTFDADRRQAAPFVLVCAGPIDADLRGVDMLCRTQCLGIVWLGHADDPARPQTGSTPLVALEEDCAADALVAAVRSLLPAQAAPPHLSEPTLLPDGSRIGTLTTMQYRVLELIAEGLLNKQIAYRCSISEATVKSHASEIFRKLGIQRRSEAAVMFTRSLLTRTFRTSDLIASA